MKPARKSRGRGGYTLVELALAMGVGIVVAGLTLMLFNQQMAFLRIFAAQDFLTREAPLINNYMVRVIGSAEGFQLYDDMASLRAGGTPVLEDASVLLLRFSEPDGSSRASVISFNDPGTGSGLYYTVVPGSGAISATPDWAISKQPAKVSFSVEMGVLRMYVTGPNEEELVYSGTDQL